MSKPILECQYCKSIISEEDTTCPKCGANTSDIIKAYRKEKEEEEEKKKTQLEKEKQEIREKTAEAAKAIATGFSAQFIISTIIFVAVFLIIAIVILSSFLSFGNKKESIVKELEEEAKGPKYTIKIDSYEAYEYYDDFFKNCNTKEGYQKVAFHFVIENTSDETISTNDIVYQMNLKAEDELVDKAELTADTHFCEVIQGKSEYNKLPPTDIISGDKLSGYLGYQIPKNKETLRFIVDDDVTIEMDNPFYEETE